MVNSNLLYESWKNERILFEMIFLKLRKRVSVKAVHDMRVCIKRLKAYRKLFYQLHKEVNLKIKLEETEKLYDTTGRLRNMHICISLIKAYEKENEVLCKEFIIFLNQNKKQAGNWSKQALKNYQATDLEAFELLLMNDESSQPDEQAKLIRKEADKELNDLAKLVEHPHRVRILLKRIYYWLKILPPGISARYYNMKLINEVLDNLGDWQDNEVLLTEIKFFRKNVLPAPFQEGKTFKKIEKTISGKKNSLKKDVLNKISLLQL
jgi:CHAD domain-containing protein